MVKVAVINGRQESGKTAFEHKCLAIVGNINYAFSPDKRVLVDICSTVEFVKLIALKCGWNGEKTPRSRKFLSDLKDLLTSWDDVPFKKIAERVALLKEDSENDWILFVDCREPTEIQKLKEQFNATTVLVRRLGDEVKETSNHADKEVFEYEYDYVVKNYGDLDDLTIEAEMFLDYMKIRKGE